MRQRRERQRAALGLPDFHHDFRTIARAIRMVAQALIDGRIDHQTTGRLLLEIQTASQLSSCLHGAADISCGEPESLSFPNQFVREQRPGCLCADCPSAKEA